MNIKGRKLLILGANAITCDIVNAAKALGVAADVYYEKDRDKYTYNDAPRQEKIL